MNVAIIPARGGSKGIPLKNLQTINNQSLLNRTIKAALNSKYLDCVFVSSDSEEVLTHAFLCGAETIKRGEDLSNDVASTDPVLIHGLIEIEKKLGEIDYITLLQCTSVFTSSEEIDEVFEGLLENIKKHDAAFATSESHSFIWSYDQLKNLSYGVNHNHELPRQRRQDLSSKQYIELGSVYVIKREALLKFRSRFGSKPIPIEVKSLNKYLEIDSFEDLRIANYIERSQKSFSKISKNLRGDLKKLKALVLDFDGVFTDNLVLTDINGQECVLCSKYDSTGLSILRKLDCKLFVITSEMNQSVAKRLQKLNIKYIQTSDSKVFALKEYMKSENLECEEIGYIGNDINDISVRKKVSIFFCPQDAKEEVKKISNYISHCSGGRGAIREICDLIINSKTSKE
ncbi:MAG: acylneuraminate cytidylyltransferase [Prochlorococcus marinus CUG1437]|nr:acylneuraminate cytidylyltransferase [Prochlorococcus marinus CUG1437]